jgi:hypothetical protein
MTWPTPVPSWKTWVSDVETTIATFTCVCGRGGFTVVDRNPPIPMQVVSIYDRDNEGEDCQECPKCEAPFPSFALPSEAVARS